MVLAIGRRWPASARSSYIPHGRSVFVCADGDAIPFQIDRSVLEAWLCRLSIPGLQYKYSVLAYGCSGFITLGEAADDGSKLYFAEHNRNSRGTGHKYPIELLGAFAYLERALVNGLPMKQIGRRRTVLRFAFGEQRYRGDSGN